MPIFTNYTPPPPQNDVPAHQQTIDFANDVGSGVKAHRDMKDNTQRTKEGMQHESSRQEVPAEHYDVSPERQRLESPDQYHKNEINSGKYGEGFQVVDNKAEQSMEEEEEMSM